MVEGWQVEEGLKVILYYLFLVSFPFPSFVLKSADFSDLYSTFILFSI